MNKIPGRQDLPLITLVWALGGAYRGFFLLLLLLTTGLLFYSYADWDGIWEKT